MCVIVTALMPYSPVAQLWLCSINLNTFLTYISSESHVTSERTQAPSDRPTVLKIVNYEPMPPSFIWIYLKNILQNFSEDGLYGLFLYMQWALRIAWRDSENLVIIYLLPLCCLNSLWVSLEQKHSLKKKFSGIFSQASKGHKNFMK